MAQAAIRAWNAMDGSIDWAALESVAEWVGADDIGALIDGLMQIRNHLRR